MLSRLIMGCITFTFQYAYFFKVIPYEWDSKSHVLSKPKLRHTYVTWCTMRNLFFGNVVWMYLNTWRAFRTPGETVTEKMFMIFGSAGYSVPAIIQLTISVDPDRALHLINSTITYYKNFEKLNWKDEAPRVRSIWELIVVIGILTSATQPYFIQVLYFSNPRSKFFVVPNLYLDANTPFYLIFLGMVPCLWSTIFGWGSAMLVITFGLFIVYNYLIIASQLRSNCGDAFTKARTREPFQAFMAYRALQLIIILQNEFIQSVLLIMVDLLLSLVVVSNFVLIVFHHELPLAGFVVFGGYSVASTAALFVLYIKLGQIHESSKTFVSSWKLKTDYAPGAKKEMIKCIKSCRLNRIEMGSVGYFQKSKSIQIVGKIVFYTTKFIMVMRPKA